MFRVESYDANDMYEEGEPWLSHGVFATADEAIAVARKITEDWIARHFNEKRPASELVDEFLSWGEIVCVFGDPRPEWDARAYVRARACELEANEPRG